MPSDAPEQQRDKPWITAGLQEPIHLVDQAQTTLRLALLPGEVELLPEHRIGAAPIVDSTPARHPGSATDRSQGNPLA